MRKKVLFLCTGNSCRSQMAEGWCRYFFADKYDCYSAGTKKHGMNDRAIKAMKESGVDISKHYSKTTYELPKMEFDYVITVCDSAKEACPYFPGGKLVHIGFDDPPQLTKEMTNEVEIMQVYSRVRDEIEIAVRNLPNLLGDIS
jgi:arsenate reductase